MRRPLYGVSASASDGGSRCGRLDGRVAGGAHREVRATRSSVLDRAPVPDRETSITRRLYITKHDVMQCVRTRTRTPRREGGPPCRPPTTHRTPPWRDVCRCVGPGRHRLPVRRRAAALPAEGRRRRGPPPLAGAARRGPRSSSPPRAVTRTRVSSAPRRSSPHVLVAGTPARALASVMTLPTDPHDQAVALRALQRPPQGAATARSPPPLGSPSSATVHGSLDAVAAEVPQWPGTSRAAPAPRHRW